MKVLITGCSRGIGKAITEYLAASGDHIIVGIARDQAKLATMKKELGAVFHPVVFDMAELQGNEIRLFQEIKSITSTIDILINNAGLLVKSSFENITPAQEHQQFVVNFFSPASLIRLMLPLMGKKRRAHVVNIASMGGVQGSQKFAGLSYYSASKAALANLTECLAEEYKDSDISFNCLALGAVQTDMLKKAFPGYKASVKPKEMGKYIADFALNGSLLFNGKIIQVTTSTP